MHDLRLKAPSLQPLRVSYRGRVIHATTSGQGGPPVVLMTGLGVPASSWWELEDDLAEALMDLMETGPWGNRPFIGPATAGFTRVITYDRAGVGQSTPPEQVRDLGDVLGELDAVLQAAEVNEPAVLVGHSVGGLVAFEFARRFPARVAGLLLLDSSHPDQAARLALHAPPEQRQVEAQRMIQMQEEHPERPDLAALLGQGPHVTTPRVLGDLPLAVISRGVTAFGPKQMQQNPDLTEADWQNRMGTWAALQAEYAAASTRGRQVQAERSGHYPQLDEPELVIAVLRDLWEDVRRQTASTS
ncbi:alpha/beta hydrolase [Deinococcus metallilatus]|uniref:Alpha/beta hydrolase n=1 Tax=Deinococcus metallilatus TaxID=1211322 RepID=A0AAJ5F2C5_9DEIO|nr:alpha/beta hydrolase [Deinococcus metallilatus]MBB5296791.1 pimeloyl-ACP methyl ester carboxylesterase [Deinococcus metallilatus]QBY09142.1 alpha/beta hydrolase [Deinococcus metallilatus]RXJ09657.1 alpha/beta hydrolase [Deinococcus metallilatus]TLK24123.1 alpha/beta hydrolase [Deinococcus metallilatus]GMA13821.1 hypothetical protein GCM10025871_01520 [Deinococcus metallilatus]